MLESIAEPIRNSKDNTWIQLFDKNSFRWQVGNGELILFLEDIWYEIKH